MTQRSRYSRPPVRNRFVLAFTALLLGILGVLASPTEGDPGGSEAFRSGLAALRAGRFASAVPDLAKAAQEYPLLGDYALFYLADARHNLQEHEAALTALRSLLQQYPTTILKKKARMAEIRELSDSGADSAELLAAFVKDYPDDDEAVYLYARLLKQQGAKEKAAGLFKRLYIHAGTLAETARAELDVEAISTADIIERTANLFRQYDFADAERDLRQALSRSTGAVRRDLQKNLAQALFRQKKYREAADLYGRVGDAFYRARSLYRAGDPQGFTRVLQEMIAAKDPKAGYLLVAAAADKRREKDYAGALQTYEEVRKNYPAEAEDALWGIGWTHYLSGEYAEAARTFDSLYETYEDTKYLYWQARSTEADGNDASALYTRVMQTENSFYASLAFARSGKPAPQLAAAPYRPDPAREKPQGQERINALIALGMRDEAVTEIAVQCQRAASIPDLLNSAALLQDLGEYRRAIGLASRLPYSEKLHRFWYHSHSGIRWNPQPEGTGSTRSSSLRSCGKKAASTRRSSRPQAPMA